MQDFKTIADKIIDLNKHLEFKDPLPEGIGVMNPFLENPDALRISSLFYKRFYNDNNQRTLLLGINPGRLGAGVTGIPFTDTKRLQSVCNLVLPGVATHEPSSAFIYEVIDAFGGVNKFYNKFLFHSVCPLGFVKMQSGKKPVNYNYYDSKELMDSTKAYIIEWIDKLVALGVNTKVCFCLGTGKNYDYLNNLNQERGIFQEIVPLEHPRYVMQYKLRVKSDYIKKYLTILS